MYTFTNKFGSSELRQRIGMMNRRSSGPSVWARYVMWVGMVGLMALACRRKSDAKEHADVPASYSHAVDNRASFPSTNATRTMANELENEPSVWSREAAMIDKQITTTTINGQEVTTYTNYGYPVMLGLSAGKLVLVNTDAQLVRVFVNGQESTVQQLEDTPFTQVDDLLVYKRNGPRDLNAPNEQYRILLGVSHKTNTYGLLKKRWETQLGANAVSGSVLGESYSFSMNQLLEATFFHDKRTFVERTKDEHLALLDDHVANTESFINGLPATPADIKTIHVREVNRLYSRERPFAEWNAENNPKKRYILYIQTAPKRAKRDSTYYVFSPFYSGDF